MNCYSYVQLLHMSGMVIILFFSAIGFVHFLITKDKAYLIYSIHLALTLLGVGAGFNAMEGELIKPTPIEGFSAILIYPIFTIYFLRLDNKSYIYKICIFITGFVSIYLIINFILSFFVSSYFIENLYNIVAGFLLFTWLFVLTLLFKRKDIISRLYLLGTLGSWVLLGITNILFMMNKPYHGIVDNPYLYSVMAFVWEAVWFSTNLAYRSHLIQEENISLLEKNMNLERKVYFDQDNIIKDMHDDLGSGLSALTFTIEMVKLNTKGNELNHEYDNILKMSNDLSDNIKEIILVTSLKNRFLENLIAFIHQYSKNIGEENNIQLKISIPKHIPNISLTSLFRKKVFVVYKRLLNALIRLANFESISIQFEIHENTIDIIFDNMHVNSENEEIFILENFKYELLEIKELLKGFGGDLTYAKTKKYILQLRMSFNLKNKTSNDEVNFDFI